MIGKAVIAKRRFYRSRILAGPDAAPAMGANGRFPVQALRAIATPTEPHLPRQGEFPAAVVTDESIAGQGHRATKDSVFSHVILLQS